jgi:hypothetical protein
MPFGLAARSGHGCGAGVGGEGGGNREACDASGLAQDVGGHDGADTAHSEEPGRLAVVDGGGDVVFQISGYPFELWSRPTATRASLARTGSAARPFTIMRRAVARLALLDRVPVSAW